MSKYNSLVKSITKTIKEHEMECQNFIVRKNTIKNNIQNPPFSWNDIITQNMTAEEKTTYKLKCIMPEQGELFELTKKESKAIEVEFEIKKAELIKKQKRKNIFLKIRHNKDTP